MAFAREIILQILQNIRFRVPNIGEKQSYYTTIGDTLVRVSDHCTWMYVWDNFLENNPKLKGKPIVSIVFEDTGDTFTEDCLLIKRFRRNPIKVNEFVYPLHEKCSIPFQTGCPKYNQRIKRIVEFNRICWPNRKRQV